MAKSPKSKSKDKKKSGGAVTTIPVEQIELLRLGVFNVVKQNTPRVREVLAGTRQWNPQQVKLYLSMLNKVMPDLSQSYNEHSHTKSLDEMSVEELKAIVAQEVNNLSIIESLPQNDPDIPIEVQVATLMNSPLMPETK